jgi:hypothetical protein
VKSSQNTKTSTKQKSAWSAALIGPAIELSYGSPGERKRLQCETKPNSNINSAIQAFGVRKLIRYSEKTKTTFPVLH